MSKFHAKPIVAKQSTRPGESSEYVGTRSTVDLLPAIFQTPVNKKFLNSTLEQLMSSGSMEAVNYYLGDIQNKNISNDRFISDNRFATNYQFVPGGVVRDQDQNITEAMTYDDLIDLLKYNEVDTTNTSRIFNETGYTLDLPIDYDMFINYHHYFWLVDFLPICNIPATAADPISVSDIVGLPYYETPTLANGKQLAFQNGMRVRFTGANITGNSLYNKDHTYIVDGVGTAISLTKQFEGPGANGFGKRVWFNDTVYGAEEPSQWDASDTDFIYPSYDFTSYDVLSRDYVVEERHSPDQSIWSRRNLWIHEEVVKVIAEYTDYQYPNLTAETYLQENFRGVRPIIAFRAGIEKYNFAKSSLGSITYVIDNIADPLNQIPVGVATNWNLAEQSINLFWNEQGYEYGSSVRLLSNGVSTYWNCIKTHTTSKNPSYSENAVYWKQVQARNLQDNDTILFLNATAPYNNNIYRVSVNASNVVTALTQIYGPSSTPLVTGAGINVRIGYNNVFGESYPNNIYSGSEWYWDGSAWVYAQQKSYRSQGIKFNLYDSNSTLLNNAATYPNSDFSGDYIFNYGTGDTTVDTALGFSPRYVDYGNTPGLSFDIELGSKRYNYLQLNAADTPSNSDASNVSEIQGYYYYKKLSDSSFNNGWVTIRNHQPVKKHIQKVVTNTDPIVIDIGTTNIDAPDTFKISKRNDKIQVFQWNSTNTTADPERINGLNPSLFIDRTKTYNISTIFDITDLEFLQPDGTALSNVTLGTPVGNTRTLTVSNSFLTEAIMYRLVSDNSVSGLIYVNSDSIPNNLTVTRNGKPFTVYTLANNKITIPSGFNINDLFDIVWHTNDNILQGTNLPADTHVLNPQNELLTDVSFGDIITHMKQQMEGIPGFTGSFFGVNSYRTLPHIHEFGGTIRQQPYSTELLNQTSMFVDSNMFNSLKFAMDSYSNFKQQFIQKCMQLHNTLDSTFSVISLVDQALTSINVGKNRNDLFANSEMIKYKEYEEFSGQWTASMSPVFKLPQTINTYDDTSNHIHVSVRDADGSGNHRWRSLLNGQDYTVTQNQLTVTSSVTFDSNGEALIKIRWYPLTSPSFAPPSAVKLGLLSKYDVKVDATSIYGHDGSITARKGTELYNRNVSGFNIEDAVLFELESRVFNNLDDKSVPSHNMYLPLASRPNRYNWTDLTNALRSSFNKWKTKNNITSVHDAAEYNVSDKFTWNYSAVGPKIGGWRGLYNYYFNTDRPHTHPWEMFGYTQKPTWWDTNYSWSDPTKRTALIAALESGHSNDPALSPKKYNLTYSYSAYDWQTNTLVTTGGVLNDPVTANVVTSPTSSQAMAEIVFGDWGTIENKWRQTSNYKLALFYALLKLRPLQISNVYFRSKERTSRSFNTLHRMYADTLMLGNNKLVPLSNSTYNDNIIELVNVKNGGSGYSSAPELSVFSNFGSGGKLQSTVSGGVITSVAVTDPGGNYQTVPSVFPDTGSATFSVILAAGANRYIAGLNNALINFAHYNNTTVSTVSKRFENYTTNPIIKAGGFINSNQEIILESSQDKGRVNIPEENINTVLYTSQPKEELFFGAVKITKVSTGYKVTGYDTTKQNFVYFKPNKDAGALTVTAGDTTVSKYKHHSSTNSTLDYNTVFDSIQDLYEFIIGYGLYLESKGWNLSWNSVASSTVIWSETAKLNAIHYAIPSVTKIEINEKSNGYFSNINNKFDGQYNVVGKAGLQLLNNKLIITRDVIGNDGAMTTIEATTGTEIYGVRLYRVEIEHVMVVDNESNFDDLIYNPALGMRHKRVIWRGSRSKNWNGKLFAPGYIVNGNSVVPNFDTVANEIDQYYGPGNTLSNQQQVDTARFNTGYNKPAWNDIVGLDDDTLFNFVKGTRKYRGTRHALNAFMRNTSLFGTMATATVHEEWAIRTADYGDTRSRNTLEFQLTNDLIKTNPQPVRFSSTELNDVLSDIVIDVDFNSPLLVEGEPGNNFTTRPSKTFNYTTIAEENLYANDFVTAGLPLLTETDYRVLNKNDFLQFPNEVKEAYSFNGDWKDIKQWDNKTAYKYKDRVIYDGKVWEMLDPDGTSGLTKPNDPIETTATVTLPVIPNTGQTVIIDGITVNLQQTTDTTTFGTINITGQNNIGDTNVVTDNSTIILGSTSADARTVTFNSTTTSTVYNNITIVGDIINPQIQGSATKTLIIDNQTVDFDETETITSNIAANTAFTNAFTNSWTANLSTIAATSTSRCTAINNLRVAYINGNSSSAWVSWLNDYFSASNAGLNITKLVNEIATTPAWEAELTSLLLNDVTIINNTLNRTYDGASVASGTETVTPGDISSAQSAIAAGQYITATKNWLIANPTTTFSSSTIVLSTTATVFKSYTLAEIIDKINLASITNTTAINSNDRLAIVKTTTTPNTLFTLTISVGTANAEVGFSTVGTTTETSSGTIVSNSPNLTIAQVVDQINNANITGVTAQLGGANNNVLQLNSNNETLYIGSGSANSVIGLSSGVTNAPTTVTQVSATVDLNSIINIINNAAISGIGASNSNNRLKLTSTNSTLILGSGTANTTLGLTAQTLSATQTTVSNVFNAFVGSDGNQIFQEMTNDPHVFSIWVADNVGDDDSSSGYAVYQTMDFGMSITKACAGINDADDAEITVKLSSSNIQAHNLVENDYVLIVGSNTLPSIDGIHRVTEVSSSSILKFYIDEYIQETGTVGNIYPLRNVRFADYATLNNNTNSTVNGVFKYNFNGYRQNNQQTPKYAFVDNDGNGNPAVYKWDGNYTNNTGHTGNGWVKVRQSSVQARNDLIESVKLYDAYTRSTITQLEIFDPAKGIIPGFIEKEIDFILTADIASYNYNTINGFNENTKSWTSEQVGLRWWDINTAVYIDYEQSSIDYKQAYWARLFDGASIDVYEWTRSSVPPEEWLDLVQRGGFIDGTLATGTPLSVEIDNETVYNWTEEKSYNSNTKRTEKSYFFWVKGKQNTLSQRNYNTYQLARLLENPSAFDISWAAAAGANELLLSNIDLSITNNTVVQVNQRIDSNALPLSEWTLLSENDPTSIIPEQLHIKMRDSLTGYNRHTERYTYTTWNNSAVYNKDVVVLEVGTGFYINLVQGNTNIQPSTDTDQSHWSRVYDYSLPDGTPESDIDISRPHALPDLNLHPYNRFGHLIRPRQSLVREIPVARQNFVETVNKLLADIPLTDGVNGWETAMNKTYVEGIITYDISPYWNYTDYIRRTYDNNDSLTYEYNTSIPPKYTATSKDELNPDLGVPFTYVNGDTLKITTVVHSDGINRPEIYSRINDEWVLEHKVKGTIQLSEELWNTEKFGIGYDISGFDTDGYDNSVDGILGNIFDGLRSYIFVGRHQVKYNKLWFKCLYQAISDNTADDFAFKTTFVKLNVEHPLLTSKEKYGKYNVNVVEDFFNSIKPFHTKLHSTADRNTHIESVESQIDEISRNSIITMKYEDHTERDWQGDTILTGGTFATAPENTDEITFTTVDGDIEYIYDGNAFQQAVTEGWGNELYPMDVHENISVLVQTNTSGSTETANTRSFRMNIWEQYNTYESTVIETAKQTTLSSAVTVSDNQLQVTDASILDSSGVVWIGSERIEYGAKDGNVLRYCTRGTYGTPAVAHNSSDVVTNAGVSSRIPILENFGHYGDNLKLAYNDSGVSLAAAGTSPEHAFIRNAGSGSI